jgi:hypothetical protein
VIGCQWNYAAGPDAKSIQTISMILCQLELAEFSALLGKHFVSVVEGNYIGIQVRSPNFDFGWFIPA